LSRAVFRPNQRVACPSEIAKDDPREVGASGGQATRGGISNGRTKVAPRPPTAAEVARLLKSPEIQRLIAELQETRWTGRPGYPVRRMVGLARAKAVYAAPTWTKIVALVGEHWALQRALGCEGSPPSKWAAYRWAAKLRENGEMVERCIDSVVEGLKAKLPEY